jgi:hypothetical protein
VEYPRSHTDPLANLVVLSALDIRRHLHDIVQRDLPIGSLPTFLHEVTHHWCFDSPVGVALHLLFLRARRAAWMAFQQRDGDDHAWDVLDKVVRYETALRLLRPLSEGMALFAEHDAIPGHTRTISTPMTVTAGLYGRALAARGNAAWAQLPLVLAAGRVSRAHVRRKADLLLQPMTCRHGGYLPGYLLVKRLWSGACARSDMFFDSDFFLQYLRSHLFDDWRLVSVLLDESKRDIGALDAIQEQVASRLGAWDTIIEGDRPQAFEATFEKGELPVVSIRTPVATIDVSYSPLEQDAAAEEGRARLQQCLQAFFKEWPEEQRLRALVQQDVRELAVRTIVNLGHATLEGRPAPNGFEIYAEGNRLAKVPDPWVPEADRTAGPVDIDLFTIPKPGGLCAALTSGHKVLCLLPIGNFDVPHQLRELIMARQRRASLGEASQRMIDEALATADIKYIIEHVRSDIDDQLTRFFVPIALMDVTDEHLARVMKETAVDGLLPVLDNDVDLVLDAAAASLCMPTPYNLRAVDSFHRWSTESAEASIEKVNMLVAAGIGRRPFLMSRGQPMPCI